MLGFVFQFQPNGDFAGGHGMRQKLFALIV
jgi:hypothetical protein